MRCKIPDPLGHIVQCRAVRVTKEDIEETLTAFRSIKARLESGVYREEGAMMVAD